jgi:NAD(P)-dependent dehydrogenase (short-subunit alcohol dehydrogenase family)
MAGSLEGRVAIVTGAGRGIGLSVARLLAREGARLVVNDLGVELDGTDANASLADNVAAQIRAEQGDAIGDQSDVADFGQAEKLIRLAVETYGRLDVLINVAGILRDRMVFNMTEEEWDSVVRVHMKGTFNTVRHASALWRDIRDADAQNRIINFTSGAGLHGSPSHSNYAAAKLGIVGFTYSCANALRKYGVTSNAIAPTAATRMTETIRDSARSFAGDEPDLSPDNVAPSVAYLASTRSDWCNGQVIAANGYQVGLYNVPRIVSELVSAGPWDLAELSAGMERQFQPVVSGGQRAGAE